MLICNALCSFFLQLTVGLSACYLTLTIKQTILNANRVPIVVFLLLRSLIPVTSQVFALFLSCMNLMAFSVFSLSWRNIYIDGFIGIWSSGPLSSVWKDWVKWCIEFGIEPNAIIAVPYDWRLSPSMLEERDLYFHRLKFVHFIMAY